MGTVKEAFTTNYANYRDRANRKEYWFFYIANTIVTTILSLIAYFLAISASRISVVFIIILILYAIAVIMPSICLSIRRIHDFNCTGFLLLLVLIPFVGWIAHIIFGCIPGTPGPNNYGYQPDDPDSNYPLDNPYPGFQPGVQQPPYNPQQTPFQRGPYGQPQSQGPGQYGQQPQGQPGQYGPPPAQPYPGSPPRPMSQPSSNQPGQTTSNSVNLDKKDQN
ncbi:MAG: DUF805 domain-containing protein [Deltaproteobacteria bacterium]|jgi:uncharacterized membrane protein YhaH (DUF805 family)|nr:DUF805 domain-containing protein [Deltaproteobacteria bacterium]